MKYSRKTPIFLVNYTFLYSEICFLAANVLTLCTQNVRNETIYYPHIAHFGLVDTDYLARMCSTSSELGGFGR